MPAAAWPGTVQMYWYFLPFLSVTVRDALFPGPSILVFLPAILKSCLMWPLLVTLNVTLPWGALLRERVNLNSFAPTLTVVAVARLEPAWATTANTVAAAASATTSEMMRFIGLLHRLMTPPRPIVPTRLLRASVRPRA